MLQQHFNRKEHMKQECQNYLESCQIWLFQLTFACIKTKKEKKKKLAMKKIKTY